MSNLIYKNFIKQLNDFYGKDPYGHGFAQRLVEFSDLTESQLQQAATRLVERPAKSYPSFAECKEALKASRRLQQADGSRQQGGFTKESYKPSSESWVKARGRCETVRPSESAAWACWKAYFSRLGLTGFIGLGGMKVIESGEIPCLAVPTKYPHEFDATAATYADLAVAELAREKRTNPSNERKAA